MSSIGSGIPLTLESSQSRNRRRSWQMFRNHKMAFVSGIVLVLFVVVAIFADQITPYDPNVTNTDYALGKPMPPTYEYALGTDNYGRDYLSRTISGIRISLFVGISAVVFQLVIGVTVGALAGYFGGWLDNLLMRITDIFLAVPAFMLLLILAGILGGTLFALIFAIGALNWMTVARLVRAQFLSLKEQEYVTAARAVGAPDWRIIVLYLLPNTMSSVIVAATLSIPSAILTESALSFLGLGVPPPHHPDARQGRPAQQCRVEKARR